MTARQLGRSGLQVSALGFGCMGPSYGYGRGLDRSAGVQLIRQAFELGVTLFDTAEAYGALNEEMVGEALAPVRDQVVIATKFGFKDGQMALAWLLARKPWIVPIPATTKLHRLRENLAAAQVALDAGELQRISEALDRITIEGARYPAAMASRVGR